MAFIGGIYHFTCTVCGYGFERFVEVVDRKTGAVETPCKSCGEPAVRMRVGAANIGLGPAERVVLWVGKDANGNPIHRNPMDPDMPMPHEFASQGYERVEYTSIHQLLKLERDTGGKVSNQRLNYDRGSGTKRPDGSDAQGKYR